MVYVVILIAVTFLGVLSMGVQLSNKSKELDELKEKQSTCVSNSVPLDLNTMFQILQEEGYFPKKDSDEEVSFKIQGTRFLIGETAGGFAYTRLYYNLEKEQFIAGLAAANEVNKSIVAVKTLIFQESETLLFSVESYCIDSERYREFLHRSLSILADSIERFREEMSKPEDAGDVQTQIIEEQAATRMESKILS